MLNVLLYTCLGQSRLLPQLGPPVGNPLFAAFIHVASELTFILKSCRRRARSAQATDWHDMAGGGGDTS
jgi:hypothetical protein